MVCVLTTLVLIGALYISGMYNTVTSLGLEEECQPPELSENIIFNLFRVHEL